MPSAYPLFETAEHLEEACARIYDALAERFLSEEEASKLFRRLAGEERQHAQRVRLLAARYRHDSTLFEGVDMAGTQLEGLLQAANQILSEIQGGGWETDLARARAALVELEGRFRAGHAEVIAALADPALQKFFTSIAAQDEHHRQLLLR